jgi:hypothetical protein
VAITCAHCLTSVDTEVSTFCKNADTDVVVEQVFGTVQFMNKFLDFAFIFPDSCLPIVINTVCASNLYYDLKIAPFWDCEEPGNVKYFLLGKKLYKIGIMSGKTTVVVVEVNDDSFLVKGEDRGFAVLGDS